MRTPTNKISAIIFLLIGLTPLIFSIFFLIKQKNIRHEMKERLEKEMLHTVVIPKKEVVWFKHNKEIKIGEKLFDVKSYNEKNGHISFVGLFDEEETALNDIMKKESDNKSKSDLTRLFQLLQSPCLSLIFDSDMIATHKISFAFIFLFNIHSPFINIPTPPPQGIMI